MPETRTWLTENPGAALTPEVVADISRTGGLIAADSWWMGRSEPGDVRLSDEATDWIRSRPDAASDR